MRRFGRTWMGFRASGRPANVGGTSVPYSSWRLQVYPKKCQRNSSLVAKGLAKGSEGTGPPFERHISLTVQNRIVRFRLVCYRYARNEFGTLRRHFEKRSRDDLQRFVIFNTTTGLLLFSSTRNKAMNRFIKFLTILFRRTHFYRGRRCKPCLNYLFR